MNRHTTQRFALVATALCSFGLTTLVVADDPPAKTDSKPAKQADADDKADAKPAAAEAAKPAAKSDGAEKAKPATPAKQPEKPVAEKPSVTAPKKDTGKDAPKTEPEKAPAKPGTTPTTRNRKPLIVPPGLLSRPPALIPETPPGLGKLNLNRCKIEDIQRLPGVGVVWAPRILAGRPYRTWGDVSRTGVPYSVIVALSKNTELGQP